MGGERRGMGREGGWVGRTRVGREGGVSGEN